MFGKLQNDCNNSQKWITVLWIFGTYLVYSFVAVISKVAATKNFLSLYFIITVSAIFICMAVYAIIYQQLIKKVDLSIVYSMKGIVIIYNLIWAAVIFKEEITFFNVIGSLLILTGIYLVGKNE